ncbi:MAG: serine hydrolase [candidate division WOR-3 bacterium]|nr:MAG: serine hydrolase [candidate division WOR-3 bacterium]
MSFSKLDDFLTDLVHKRRIPGFVCWVGNLSTSFYERAYGFAQLKPKRIDMSKNTVFDLASLTKPLATALLIMLMHEKGILDIDHTLEQYLPVFKGKPNARKSLRQLLTHTGGMPAWYPTYLISETQRLEFLSGLSIIDEEPVYSCLGYILLANIVENITGMGFNRYFEDNITSKLGLHTIGFGPVHDQETVAATELGSKHERAMARRHGDISTIKWRPHLIQGEVHDGNAYYSYGGVAGNAGLFSNLTDLVAITRAYMSGGLLNPATLHMMIYERAGSRERRNLGWCADPYPDLLSPESFGHTGFTGTMLTIDPRTNLIVILLTNAIHPKVRLGLMNPIRRTVIQLISDTLSVNRKLGS